MTLPLGMGFSKKFVLSTVSLIANLSAYETVGKIEKLHPELDHLIDPSAKIEVLAEGFRWSEGPVWDSKNARLLFSDVPNNVMHSWSEKDGLQTFMKPSGYTGEGKAGGSNGLAFDQEGLLLICEHGDRRISKLLPDGTKTTVIDQYLSKKLNSPNDLVLTKSGSLFFTDPPYGLKKKDDDTSKEQEQNGVYRLDPDKSVTLLIDDLIRPNGIALSPDEKILYVAQSQKGQAWINAYDLDDQGNTGPARRFFDATELAQKDPGLPDGLKVDVKGNVWSTGPGGVLILDPTGKLLGRILTGSRTANCGWGDDGQTLYLTAASKLLRVRTKTKGLVY